VGLNFNSLTKVSGQVWNREEYRTYESEEIPTGKAMSGKGMLIKRGQGKGNKTQANGGNSNAPNANNNQFFEYLYLDNSDKSKYGSILPGLNMQQSLENNQYPKSITESNNVLSNHWFDAMPKAGVKNKAQNDCQRSKEQKSERKEGEKVNLSFAQMEGKCNCCLREGWTQVAILPKQG
jgi:hypothetical protein